MIKISGNNDSTLRHLSNNIEKLTFEIINKFNILDFIYHEEYLQTEIGFEKSGDLQKYYENNYYKMSEKEKREFGLACKEKEKDLIEYYQTLL